MLVATSTLAHSLLEPFLIHLDGGHKPRKYAEGPIYRISVRTSIKKLSTFAMRFIPYTTTFALRPQHLANLAHSTQHRPGECPPHRFECMFLVGHEMDPIMDTPLDYLLCQAGLQVYLREHGLGRLAVANASDMAKLEYEVKYIPCISSISCLVRRTVSNSARHDLCRSLNAGGTNRASVARTVTGALSRTPLIVIFTQETFPFIQVCARRETIAAI